MTSSLTQPNSQPYMLESKVCTVTPEARLRSAMSSSLVSIGIRAKEMISSLMHEKAEMRSMILCRYSLEVLKFIFFSSRSQKLNI